MESFVQPFKYVSQCFSVVVGMDSSSDGNSPVSYASVVRGYSSPSEKWSEYQKEGDAMWLSTQLTTEKH